MKLNDARQLCPHLIQRPSRPERYAVISANILNAIKNIVPDIEPFSIDKCFLDLVPVLGYYGSVTKIAELLREAVFTSSGGIVCSIGISEGKLTAKYCASTAKGQTTIFAPDKIANFMADAPVEAICGIGKSLTRYLNSHNIYLCKDLQHAPTNILSQKLGRIGSRLHSTCLGHDPEPVNIQDNKPKSMGQSKILPPATTNFDIVQGILHQLCARLSRRLRAQNFVAPNVWIGLKTQHDWIQSFYRFNSSSNHTQKFFAQVNQHLKKWHGQPLFQVSVQCYQLLDQNPKQADFFAETYTVRNCRVVYIC